MAGIRCQLVQLDGISDRRNEILSNEDQLSGYIRDISSLYSALHEKSVKISCESSHGFLDIRLCQLPIASSDISRFLKIELRPDLPSLLHHIGDSHVMSIQPNSQEALVTVRLPKLSEVVAVQLTVSLLYKCPGIIEASVREEKQIFSVELYKERLYSSPSSCQTTPHYSTKSCTKLLEKYLNSVRLRDSNTGSRDVNSTTRDLYNVTFHCSNPPSNLPGNLTRSGEEDTAGHVISGLSVEQLYEVIVKLRGVELQGEGRNVCGDVSMTSSLMDLSESYKKMRSIS